MLCFLLVFVALAGCGGTRTGPMKGQRVPDASFVTMEGNRIRVSDFAGKPVVINFWATWCGPCKEEIPELQAAHEQYSASDGLTIIGVTDEDPGVVEPFVADNGMTFPVAYDRIGVSGSRYRVQSIPTTLFVDSEGIVMERYTGSLGEGRLKLYIERLLSRSSETAPTSEPAAPTSVPVPTEVPAQPTVPPVPPQRDDVGFHRKIALYL
jgi:thiol-disulfide isomerase/thioredoxin